ncbi:MAG: periplasmic heavy metal sensor [Akkermansiaceae bacterium]|nr:periplasmic heavy metal sensor [Akkermansiaceae bacterium]
MKRGLTVALAIMLVGLLGFGISRSRKEYRMSGILVDTLPELVWLKSELSLTDEQLRRATDLHRAYRPKCEEMCHKLSAAHETVERLSRGGVGMTGELKAAIEEHAAVHAECQEAMLEHLYETAGLFGPEKAREYLNIMIPHALDSAHGVSDVDEGH